MRLLTIISLIIYFTIASYAQISVTGKLLDAETENPIDFANISVSKSGETAPFTGTVTDADGNFTVSLSKGS